MTSNDVFLGGGTSSGSYISQSLPNIKGQIGTIQGNSSATYGYNFNIFNGGYADEVEKYAWEGGFSLVKLPFTCHTPIDVVPKNPAYSVKFEASKSNSIYQDGANVRPKHYVIEFWIKFK